VGGLPFDSDAGVFSACGLVLFPFSGNQGDGVSSPVEHLQERQFVPGFRHELPVF
jgi:hypothetical protein